jgi:hypothetical protein
MLWKKIVGGLFVFIGFGCIGFSMYIDDQVDQGKHKVRKAQSAVNTANAVTSSNSTLSFFGGLATSPIQDQINEGKRDIAYYNDLSQKFTIGGWILIVSGAALFAWGFKKQK